MYNGNDRVSQVNEIDRMAGDIRQFTDESEGTPQERVEFWLEGKDLPGWWDEHDTGLLVDRVSE